MADSIPGYKSVIGQQSTQTANASNQTGSTGYYPGKHFSDAYKQQMKHQADAASKRIAKEKQIEAEKGKLALMDEIADAQGEGDVAFGSAGKNTPGDTRMAKATLGFLTNDMDRAAFQALIESAKLPPGANR